MADFTRVYTGNDGLSHFEDRECEYGDPTTVAHGVSGAGASIGEVKAAAIRKAALGNSNKHAATRRQYAVILTGSMVIQAGDGEERQFVPGDVLLMEDTTGDGHLSTFSDGEPGTFLTVHLAE